MRRALETHVFPEPDDVLAKVVQPDITTAAERSESVILGAARQRPKVETQSRYSVVKDRALRRPFVMRNLLTEPLSHRVTVESNQAHQNDRSLHAHECRSLRQ